MSLPPVLRDRLRLPVIASPLFIISGPELVIAQCKAGIVGSFPSLNARPISVLDEWLARITEELAAWDRAHPEAPSAPFAVNQIVHKTNNRLEEDLALCVKYKAPVVITSLGAREDVNAAIHSYGGITLHDVITDRFARKAVEKGADGLIAVAAGAGGHAGVLSPFALVQEIRAWFDGPLALSGSIANGAAILGAQAMGADLAYIGSAFIATQEANAQEGYKQMIVETRPATTSSIPTCSPGCTATICVPRSSPPAWTRTTCRKAILGMNKAGISNSPAAPRAGSRARAPGADPSALSLAWLLEEMVKGDLITASAAKQVAEPPGRRTARSRIRWWWPQPRIGPTGASQGRKLSLEALTQWLATACACLTCASIRLKLDVASMTEVVPYAYAVAQRDPADQERTHRRGLRGQGSVRRGMDAGAASRCSRFRSSAFARTPGHRPVSRGVLRHRALGEDHRPGARAARADGAAKSRTADRAFPRRQAVGRGPARRRHRRLAAAVRLRFARQRHPPRAAPRDGQRAVPHRRRAARRLSAARPGDARRDQPRQDLEPARSGGAAASPGRPYSHALARRQGNRAAGLGAAHGLRREAGAAHLQSRRARARLQPPRLHGAGGRHVAPDDRAAARNRAGHGTDRFGKDHDAVCELEGAGHAGGQCLHHRRPHRADRRQLQPDAGAAQHRSAFRRRGARACCARIPTSS